MPRRLRELVVVLGGIREVPMSGARQSTRTSTRRRGRVGDQEATFHRTKSQNVRLYPAQWRRAHRLVKTWRMRLSRVCFHTPIGQVALRSRVDELLVVKEGFNADAADHNNENPYWQVVDEMTWCLIDARGRSDLLTIMGGDMPDSFWEEVP